MMRSTSISSAVCAVAMVAAGGGLLTSAQFQGGMPDMPMGGDGMPPINARFGHQRRDRFGTYDHMPGGSPMAGGGELEGPPPGVDIGEGHWEAPPMQFNGGMGDMMSEEEMLMRMERDGEFRPDDMAADMPDQDESVLADHPMDDADPGQRGWVRTGKFRRPSDPEPRRREGEDAGNAEEAFNKMQDMEFMDEEFTGMPAMPSRNRRPKGQSGMTADGKPIEEIDTATCFKAAMRICPLRVMNDDYAAFVQCVVSKSESMEGSCEGWAETHAECMDDMVAHCSKRDPPETTRCLIELEKGNKLGEVCAKSDLFVSMKDGFAQMEARMQASEAVFSAAAVGESAAYEDEHGPGSDADGSSSSFEGAGGTAAAADEL